MVKMLLLLISASYATTLTPRLKNIPRHVFRRPYGGFTNQKNFLSGKDVIAPYDCDEISYFERFVLQPINHFSNKSRMWSQFYQYNRKFYNGSSDLVFLMIGGEAPIDPKGVCNDDIPYLKWAKHYGAAVFQAEHRFYGHSRPVPTLSVADFRWFTPEQILADYNNFIKEMNIRYFGKKKMRWVLFGGSYAGTLVAWMRVAYPNSTIGGISSSSAVNLQVDNYNCAVNMQKNYARTSQICAKNIDNAFKKLQSMSFSKTGRSQLEIIFKLCTEFPNKVRPKNLQFFWANIFVEFQSLNQYSGDNRDNDTTNVFGMPKACEIMNNASESNLVIRIQNVLQWVSSFNGEEDACTPNIYEDYINTLANITYDETGDNAAGRSWMYQCCSYLGYFATTDAGSGMWGSLIPVEFVINQCMDIFGSQFNLDYTYAQVKKYSKMFGDAKHYKGSKCVFVNSNMDPWFSLGLHPGDENQAKQVFSITIDGETHCSDMYPARPQDSAPLKAARVFIASKLDSFIRSS